MPHDKERTLRSSADLLAEQLIAEDQLNTIRKVEQQFAIAVNPHIKNMIKKHGDSLYRQFVPSADELRIATEEQNDPIGDQMHCKVKGIIHRYPDRCLLQPISVCPVYCRFCFRREKVGPGNAALSPQQLQTAIAYIAQQPQLWEVIISGGDPLLMKPDSLKHILEQLGTIDHIKVIRIHTRVAVTDPSRIDHAMIQALKSSHKAVFVVLHTNHADELSSATVKQACGSLIDAGIPMLSQTVLLKGINDNEESLSSLMRSLVAMRIKPYYLHHGDLAKGTRHFRTTIATGQQLMRQLQGRYSGLCQPSYVLDIPDGHGKAPINPNYLAIKESNGNVRYTVTDYQGQQHNYTVSENMSTQPAKTKYHTTIEAKVNN